ncbi:MAG: rhomboid family intramembrane serine protease [Bacteroidota bacterium]
MNFGEYPITLILIGINIIVSLIGFGSEAFINKTIMWPYGISRNKEYYRFISSGFIHADFVHLLFNMITLYFFGQNLEYYFKDYALGGSISYIFLYFLGMIAADLPTYNKQKDNKNYLSLGASGAVSAVVFATILFSPWSTVRLYGAIQISLAVYAILYLLYCVYMSKKGGGNINHDAHLWGSVFGLIFTLALIAVLQPWLFTSIIEELQHPSLFGRG